MSEFSYIIRNKTNMLQDFSSPEKCSTNEDQEQSQPGVVNKLYDILDQFRKYNSVLNDAKNSLITLLG